MLGEFIFLTLTPPSGLKATKVTTYLTFSLTQACPLIKCVDNSTTMMPCALHLILAIHRYMWKFVTDVIINREQEDLIPDALISIKCNYFAYQYTSYLKRFVY